MNLFHTHIYEPYHLTEIFYMRPGRKEHLRLFECCLICGVARVKDLAPGEIPPLVLNVEEL